MAQACCSSLHLACFHPPHTVSHLALPAGVPATPEITASGGGLSSANVTWSASPTTAYYLVELLSQGVVKKSARVEHRCAAYGVLPTGSICIEAHSTSAAN